MFSSVGYRGRRYLVRIVEQERNKKNGLALLWGVSYFQKKDFQTQCSANKDYLCVYATHICRMGSRATRVNKNTGDKTVCFVYLSVYNISVLGPARSAHIHLALQTWHPRLHFRRCFTIRMHVWSISDGLSMDVR